jgi:hypothetical protein
VRGEVTETPLRETYLDKAEARAKDLGCPDCGCVTDEMRQLGERDVPMLVGEIRRQRKRLLAESLRADRAENARDQVGRMLHQAQERLTSVRNGVEHIQQLAAVTERTHGEDDPVAITLRATARSFLAALGTGAGPGGAESNADGRTGPVATDGAPEPGREAQRGAEAVPLSVCGKHSKPGLGGILGPCIKAQGHPGTGDWHLDARGAAWDPNIDADASEQQAGAAHRAAAMLGRAADERTTPPACPDCGMPETNCYCG